MLAIEDFISVRKTLNVSFAQKPSTKTVTSKFISELFTSAKRTEDSFIARKIILKNPMDPFPVGFLGDQIQHNVKSLLDKLKK